MKLLIEKVSSFKDFKRPEGDFLTYEELRDFELPAKGAVLIFVDREKEKATKIKLLTKFLLNDKDKLKNQTKKVQVGYIKICDGVFKVKYTFPDYEENYYEDEEKQYNFILDRFYPKHVAELFYEEYEKYISKTYDRRYKNLKEIQDTFEERKGITQDNFLDVYYDPKNVCVIHLKFDKAQKEVHNLTEKVGLTKEFIKEFTKYWNNNYYLYDHEKEQEKTAEIERHKKDISKVLKIIKKDNLPVIFYQNYNCVELSFTQVMEYFGLKDEDLK